MQANAMEGWAAAAEKLAATAEGVERNPHGLKKEVQAALSERFAIKVRRSLSLSLGPLSLTHHLARGSLDATLTGRRAFGWCEVSLGERYTASRLLVRGTNP
jgi:hypothetical protein